jgi:hypothetical protein
MTLNDCGAGVSPAWRDAGGTPAPQVNAMNLDPQPESDWMVDLKKTIVSRMLTAVEREEAVFLRSTCVGLERGEAEAWSDFVAFATDRPRLASRLLEFLEGEEYLRWRRDANSTRLVFTPGAAGDYFFEAVETLTRELETVCREPAAEPAPELRTAKKKSDIMYIEAKPGLTGPARIGRVEFSKTGKTVYYRGRAFQSLKGGYQRNYFDILTGEEFRISRCRKDGQDAPHPGIVEIDEDVREEYWRDIRQCPDMVEQRSLRSEGKYSR